MAYTFALLAGNQRTTGPFSQIVTASINPTGPVLVSAYVSSSGILPTVSGCGLTWVLVKKEIPGSGLYLWLGNGTPTAGAITIDAPGATWSWAGWQVYQVNGASAAGVMAVAANIVAATANSDGSTPIVWTYPQAFGAGSAGFAVVGDISGSGPEDKRVGWTRGTVQNIPGFGSLCAVYRSDADTAVSVTETSVVPLSGIAVEIASANTAPTVTIDQKSTIGSTIYLPVGATLQLSATITDPDAADSGLTATWSSGTPAAATVSAGGLVTAVAEGTSAVQASTGPDSGGASASDSVSIVVDNTPGAGGAGFDVARFKIHALGGIA